MEVRYWYTDGTVIEEHWYGWALMLVGRCFIQEHSCIQTFVLVSLLFLSPAATLFVGELLSQHGQLCTSGTQVFRSVNHPTPRTMPYAD